ncbi:hypothetical protein niasHT_001021 [Heterodera trifolii]|uniref:Uncharacterized protein n=1 Tax=Heterodera trifolii TaxID=157864 RepID=A0ABD2LT14_9BILA
MMKSARRRATIGHLSNRHVDWCQPTAQNSLHYRRKVFDKLLDENSSARKLVGRHSSISCHADNGEKQQDGGGAGIIGIVKQQRQQRYCYSSQPNSRKTSENVGNSPRHVPPQPAATLPRLAETLPLEIVPAIGSLRGTVNASCAMGMLQQQNQRRPVTARTGCRLRQYSLQSFPFQPLQKHSQPQLSTIQSGIVMRKMSAGPSFYSQSPSLNHPNNQPRDGAIGNMNNAETGKSHTALFSFSGSSDSVLNSCGQNDNETHEQESKSNIDPVYLALKEATEKYGNKAGKYRCFSQNICGVGTGDSATTPSSCLPRNLSQASLLDSGTFSASGDSGGIGSGFNNASSTGLFVISGGSTSQLEGGQ